MSEKGAEAVVAGHIALDIIPELTEHSGALAPGALVQVGPVLLSAGGSVSNTGLALHRLGIRTRLVAKVGDDLFGRALTDIVGSREKSLTAGLVAKAGEATSYTMVISPPGIDRSFLHFPGANDTFGAEDIPYDKVAKARLFHLGYPPLMRRLWEDGGEGLREIFTRVKDSGVTTSLDMARPDPASPAGRADWEGLLKRVLPGVDVFLPSLDEILFMIDRERFDEFEKSAAAHGGWSGITGEVLSEAGERLLEMGSAIVVLKLGAEGLYVRTTPRAERLSAMGALAPGEFDRWLGREFIVPCFEVEVAGTTGAGDCTIAGFLTGLLKGLSAEDCAMAAVGTGAMSVEVADATGGVRPYGELVKRIENGWERLPSSLELEGWEWDNEAVAYSPQDGNS